MDIFQLQAYLDDALPEPERMEIAQALEQDRDVRAEWTALQQQQEMLHQCLAHIDPPSEIPVEQALAAFFQRHPQPEGEAIPPQSSVPSTLSFQERWRREWQLFLQSFLGQGQGTLWLGSATCVLLFAFVLRSPSSLPHEIPAPSRSSAFQSKSLAKASPARKGTLRAKELYPSARSTTSENDAVLHVGYVRKDDAMHRLGDGDKCRASDKLGFAFTLNSPGYVYLFLIERGKVALLYPFEETKGEHFSAGYHPLQMNGVFAQYQLHRHRGRLEIVLLKTSRPVTPKGLVFLRNTVHPLGLQRISSVAWEKSWRKEVSELSWNRVVLHVSP